MRLRDLNIVSALLCLDGVSLKNYSIKIEDNRAIFYFELDGRSEKEFRDLIDKFFDGKFLVDAKTFIDRRNYLLDLIKSHGLEFRHQLPDGSVVGTPIKEKERKDGER